MIDRADVRDWHIDEEYDVDECKHPSNERWPYWPGWQVCAACGAIVRHEDFIPAIPGESMWYRAERG